MLSTVEFRENRLRGLGAADPYTVENRRLPYSHSGYTTNCSIVQVVIKLRNAALLQWYKGAFIWVGRPKLWKFQKMHFLRSFTWQKTDLESSAVKCCNAHDVRQLIEKKQTSQRPSGRVAGALVRLWRNHYLMLTHSLSRRGVIDADSVMWSYDVLDNWSLQGRRRPPRISRQRGEHEGEGAQVAVSKLKMP